MEISTAFGFVPEVTLSCDGMAWSHPATSTGIGQVDYYFVAVNGGEVTAYTPGEVLDIAWPEDGSQVLVTLQGSYEPGLKHQLGQTKRVEPEECNEEIPLPEEPETPAPEVTETTVQVPVGTLEATLPATGADLLTGSVFAVVLLVAGASLALKQMVTGRVE